MTQPSLLWRVRRHVAALAIVTATWVLGSPAAVVAETGYTWFEPTAAPPGAPVDVRVDPYNCDGWNGDRLPMRLFREFGEPLDAILDLVRAGEPGNFRFTVPRLSAGAYWIELECAPGEWLGVGVGGEGGPEQFRILPPETATLAPDPDATWSAPLGMVLPAGAFTVAFLLVARRRIPGPRSGRA